MHPFRKFGSSEFFTFLLHIAFNISVSCFTYVFFKTNYASGVHNFNPGVCDVFIYYVMNANREANFE